MKTTRQGVKLNASFIGCGKLGMAMAYLLFKNNAVALQDIYNRTPEKNKLAIDFIKGGTPCTDLTKIKPADLYFISTPDDHIEKTCNQLVGILGPGGSQKSVFVHFSGLLTSDVLASAKDAGYDTCSLHPIKSFAKPDESCKNFKGTFCAFEGDKEAFQMMSKIIGKIDGHIFFLEKEKKELYHVAGIFAANYLVTLFHCAEQCYETSGLSKDMAKRIILSLMQGTLHNLKNVEKLADALTGPLQRGDANTVQKHVENLKHKDDIKKCYQILGKKTLELTRHDQETKLSLINILEKQDDR